jgi:hypothetical protein
MSRFKKRQAKLHHYPLTDEEVRQDFLSRGYTFAPTTDDWSPTFPDGTVAVSRIMESPEYWQQKYPERPAFKILVIGGDDTGLEKEFYTHLEAQEARDALPVIITMQDLLERGFEPA